MSLFLCSFFFFNDTATTEIYTLSLHDALPISDDLASGVENPGDERRVDVGHVAFENGGAVHHRDPGHAHVVLDRDLLASQRSRGGAFDRALPVPRVEPVLGRRRAVARIARVLHGQ